MFDISTYVRNLLINSTMITDLVQTSSILSTYPETITIFPLIILGDSQRDIHFVENKPDASYAIAYIDVYVKDDTPTPICTAICDLFRDVLWSCEYNSLVPDPDASIRHRTMRFSRPIVAGDI